MTNFYYAKTIKGVIVSLMDMFNDIKVFKYDSSGISAKEISVPFTFGPAQKALLDRTENHYFDTTATDADGWTQATETNQVYYLQTPRIALTLTSITYNPDRAYGVNEFRYWLQQSLDLSATDLDRVFSDYQPTPYDLNFNLAIMTDSMDYLSQILENILPYFNPKLYLRVKEFSFLNIERDLPVILGGVPLEFSSDMGENDKREVNASMDLTVEAFMYRPWTYSKIIKVINSRYFIDTITTFTSASAVLSEEFSTSGYMTSGGQYLSGTTPPTSYDFSGTYQDGSKSYNWFKDSIQT